MARPIGIFSVLMALGGYLAVRYVQSKRAGRYPTARELSRWEGEGGAVATPATATTVLSAETASPGSHGGNGSAHANGDGRAWPFPRS